MRGFCLTPASKHKSQSAHPTEEYPARVAACGGFAGVVGADVVGQVIVELGQEGEREAPDSVTDLGPHVERTGEVVSLDEAGFVGPAAVVGFDIVEFLASEEVARGDADVEFDALRDESRCDQGPQAQFFDGGLYGVVGPAAAPGQRGSPAEPHRQLDAVRDVAVGAKVLQTRPPAEIQPAELAVTHPDRGCAVAVYPLAGLVDTGRKGDFTFARPRIEAFAARLLRGGEGIDQQEADQEENA